MSSPTIFAPSCLAELERLEPLADNPSRSDVRFVGGGTLEVPRWQAAGAPRFGVYLPGIRELNVLDSTVCGAALTLARAAAEPRLPRLLREMAAACATPTVRTVATLGGNLAACQPGCMAVALLALDATVTVMQPGRGLRRVPVAEVLPSGGRESRAPGVIVQASWDGHPELCAIRRATLQAGAGLVMATVAVAARRHEGRLRWTIAVGGAAMPPQRLEAVHHLLDDLPAESARNLAEAAASALTLRPAAALGEHAEYQRHLVGLIVARAVDDAREPTPRGEE